MNNVVTTLAPSFLIGSSSFLQVIGTTIKSRMGLKFSQIGPWTVELTALELLEKITIDLQWEICCDHSSPFKFELIFFILADKKDNYKSLKEFAFLQDPMTYCGVSCP